MINKTWSVELRYAWQRLRSVDTSYRTTDQFIELRVRSAFRIRYLLKSRGSAGRTMLRAFRGVEGPHQDALESIEEQGCALVYIFSRGRSTDRRSDRQLVAACVLGNAELGLGDPRISCPPAYAVKAGCALWGAEHRPHRLVLCAPILNLRRTRELGWNDVCPRRRPPGARFGARTEDVLEAATSLTAAGASGLWRRGDLRGAALRRAPDLVDSPFARKRLAAIAG